MAMCVEYISCLNCGLHFSEGSLVPQEKLNGREATPERTSCESDRNCKIIHASSIVSKH